MVRSRISYLILAAVIAVPASAAFRTGEIGTGSFTAASSLGNTLSNLIDGCTSSCVTPAVAQTVANALASSTQMSISDGDALAFADTNGDGNIDGNEFVAVLSSAGLTGVDSSDNGLYARAYAEELADLTAPISQASLQTAITAGNGWTVNAPTITTTTTSFNGTSSSNSSGLGISDGAGVALAGASAGLASITLTATHSGGVDYSNSFAVDSDGNLELASGTNIQDLDAGTYTISVTATDTNTDTYGKSQTQDVTLTLSNENGCITNTQVSGSDFDANTDSITGAAVSITGSFNSSDLLFIQGPNVTVATVGANSIKKYTNLEVSGVTEARYDPATGIMRFYGTASEANWVTLFKRVGYIFNSGSSPSTSTRTLAFTLSNRVPYLHSDGKYHYYEYYQDDDITFKEAREAAASSGKQLFGMTGYLATPTSQAEQDVLTEKVQGIGWLGACDNLDDATPKDQCGVSDGDIGSKTVGEGHWYWVTGPEKMTKFGYDNGTSAWTVTSNRYENWNGTAGPDEPNNCCSTEEHYLHVWSSAKWNDFHYNNGAIQGYLVEWGGMSSDPDRDLDQTVSYSIPNGDANFCSYAE